MLDSHVQDKKRTNAYIGSSIDWNKKDWLPEKKLSAHYTSTRTEYFESVQSVSCPRSKWEGPVPAELWICEGERGCLHWHSYN